MKATTTVLVTMSATSSITWFIDNGVVGLRCRRGV